MALKTAIYVINPVLGWDNVMAMFDADFVTKEEVEAVYKGDQYGDYIIVTKELEQSLDSFD